MRANDILPADWEQFEYHGSTIVERIQVVNGLAPQRDWLLFDTVEEAAEFYYENQAGR